MCKDVRVFPLRFMLCLVMLLVILAFVVAACQTLSESVTTTGCVLTPTGTRQETTILTTPIAMGEPISVNPTPTATVSLPNHTADATLTATSTSTPTSTPTNTPTLSIPSPSPTLPANSATPKEPMTYRLIFRTLDAQLHSVFPNGLDDRSLVDFPVLGAVYQTRQFDLDPDGRRLVYLTYNDQVGATAQRMCSMEVLDLGTLQSETLLPASCVEDKPHLRLLVPRWSPDGQKIAYIQDYNVWVMNADGRNTRLLAEVFDPDTSPENHQSRWDVGAIQLGWSADSKLLAFNVSRLGGGGIAWLGLVEVDAENPTWRRVGEEKDPLRFFRAWGPVGDRLLFIEGYSLRESQPWRLVLLNVADGDRRVFTQTDAVGIGPITWSPDGTKIAYVADHGPDARIVIFDVKTGSLHSLQPEGVGNYHDSVVWSPDSSILFFEGCDHSGQCGIWCVNGDGTEVRFLVEGSSPLVWHGSSSD